MDTKNALISVIIPIYNAEAFLEECVKSVLNQTYEDLEVILVNDGSPDGSGEVCDALAKRYNKIKVVHKQNGGASSARNAGLEVAQGEFIAFVDSDDRIIDAYMFEQMHRSITEEDADISVSGYIQIYNNYIQKKRVPGENKISYKQVWEAFLEDYRCNSAIMFPLWNKLFRASLIQGDENDQCSIRFKEELKTQEDTYFITDCIKNLKRGIVFVDITPYAYMIDNNPSSLTKVEMYENIEKAAAHIEEAMMSALPQKELEIKNTLRCQKCIGVTFLYHRVLVNKQKPIVKLRWKTVATILRYSKNNLERFSALFMFFLPAPLYRVVFKVYCRFT